MAGWWTTDAAAPATWPEGRRKALTFLVFGINFLLMLAPPAVTLLALSGVLS